MDNKNEVLTQTAEAFNENNITAMEITDRLIAAGFPVDQAMHFRQIIIAYKTVPGYAESLNLLFNKINTTFIQA